MYGHRKKFEDKTNRCSCHFRTGDSLASGNGICAICFPICDSGSYADTGSGGNAFCFHGTI